jgi:hypothetical protein
VEFVKSVWLNVKPRCWGLGDVKDIGTYPASRVMTYLEN